MATKGAVLHSFFNSFGIPAYVNSGVPDNAEFPWLTYQFVANTWEDGAANITVNLWYRTESEAVPNAKAQEMANVIGLGGIVLPCDGGAIWVKRGSPWCQTVVEEDPMIKRRYLNVTLEYFTEN